MVTLIGIGSFHLGINFCVDGDESTSACVCVCTFSAGRNWMMFPIEKSFSRGFKPQTNLSVQIAGMRYRYNGGISKSFCDHFHRHPNAGLVQSPCSICRD